MTSSTLFDVEAALKRDGAPEALAAAVDTAFRELTTESFARFEQQVLRRVFDLLLSNDPREKLGSLAAMDALIESPSGAQEVKAVKFANGLKNVITASHDDALLEAAAKALGHLAKASPMPTNDFVDFELNRGLEWLCAGPQYGHRRLAACLVLKELASCKPTLFFRIIGDFFERIWPVLRDARQSIRDAAADAMAAALQVLAERPSPHHLEFLFRTYDQVKISFGGNCEGVHASLRVAAAMVAHCPDFMAPRFDYLCETVLSVAERPGRGGLAASLVRATVTRTLPVLAAFAPDAFARRYLRPTLSVLTRDAQPGEVATRRAQALLALGHVCRSMGDQLLPHMEDLVKLARDSMVGSRTAPFCPEALQYTSSLVQALGPLIAPAVPSLVEPMMSTGVSTPLMETLTSIAQVLPEHKGLIQQRLLGELTTALSGKPFMPPGTTLGLRNKRRPRGGNRSKSSSSSDSSSSTRRHGVAASNLSSSASTLSFSSTNHAVPDSLVLLSLKTLANFRMEGVCLLPFVRNCVVGYLHHAQPQVRLEAVIASTRLLMDPSAMALRGGPSAEVVQHVLETLLKTALADPEPTLRLRLIHELDHATFNGWLKQPSHLALFVSFLCDEDLRVRLAALRLLGRLAPLNPAFALPPLRLTLTRLIAELQLQTDVSGKEEATRMLCEFLKADALRPLVQPLVRALVHALPLYGAVSPRLSTAALDAVGELCLVMGVEMAPYSTYLMPVIITTMHDASSTLRREVALRTLGRLVSSTGAVVKPYLEYPHLLPGILQVLREGGSSQPWSLKQEILRTLGLLGALDPYKFDALQALPEISKNALSHLTSPRESSSSRAAGFDALALSSDAATATGNAAVGSSAAAAHAQASSSSSTSLTANGVAFKSGLSSSSAAVSGHLAQLRLLDEGDSDAPAHTIMYEQSAMVAQPSAPGDGGEAPRLTPASEDYNPKVAVGALMKILRDPSLSAHHALVTQAVMHIFQNLGLKCVPFLNEIIPHMLHAVGSATEATMRESLLQQLAALTRIIKVHLHPFLPHLFDLVCTFWHFHTEQVLALVEELAASLRDQFRPFVPRLLPLLLQSLVAPTSNAAAAVAAAAAATTSTSAAARHHNKVVSTGGVLGGSSSSSSSYREGSARTLKLVLRTMVRLRAMLRAHANVVVPALAKLVDAVAEQLGREAARAVDVRSVDWPSRVVVTLAHVCNDPALKMDPTVSLAPRLMRSLMRLVDRPGPPTPLTNACMVCLAVVAYHLGPTDIDTTLIVAIAKRKGTSSFDILANNANGVSSGSSSGHNPLDTSKRLTILLKNLSDGDGDDGSSGHVMHRRGSTSNNGSSAGSSSSGGSSNDNNNAAVAATGNARLPMNQQNLKRAWDVSQRTRAEDWSEWLRRFSVELLRESPSPALRACFALAQVHDSLARDLFHAAFVSCWFELAVQPAYQEHLVRSLEVAFRSDSIPPEILQSLLNLAEFMEHDAEALPIDIRVLADLAHNCHAHAKALHYKEHVFQKSPASCVEDLISINKKLDQPEAAQGILKFAQKSALALGLPGPFGGEDQTERESCLSKLAFWDQALMLYQRRLAATLPSVPTTTASSGAADAPFSSSSSASSSSSSSVDSGAVLGAMKCLDAMGEWQAVLDLCFETWAALNNAEATEDKTRKKAAALAAHAAWSLGQWDNMERLLTVMEPGEMAVEGPYFRAVLAVHHGRFDECALHVDRARKLLHHTLSALMAESYTRAYTSLVLVQQLAEIEEVVALKKLESNAGRAEEAAVARLQLKDKWDRRLGGCRLEVRAWERILKVRSLVFSATDNVDSWLRFSSLCRHSGNLALAERVLTHQLGSNLPGRRKLSFHNGALLASQNHDMSSSSSGESNHVSDLEASEVYVRGNTESGCTTTTASDMLHLNLGSDPRCVAARVRYSHLKHMWAVGRTHEALDGMHDLARALQPVVDAARHHQQSQPQHSQQAPLLSPSHSGASSSSSSSSSSSPLGVGFGGSDAATKLLVRALLKQGEWQLAQVPPGSHLDAPTQTAVLDTYHAATSLDPNSNAGWHAWAMVNFRIMEQLQLKSSAKSSTMKPMNPATSAKIGRQLIVSATYAAQSFLRAVALGRKKWSGSVQQDLLNLLNVWFWYGHVDEVAAVLTRGFAAVSLDAWLGVLPQLIARIHTANERVYDMLHALLSRLGRTHPQALVYPLSVALKSRDRRRWVAAEKLLAVLQEHSANLVEQARSVSAELIRVAILWHELWHEGLEEASRLYFLDGNVRGMLDTLLPLHAQLAAGPQTLREASFQEAFGQELSEAQELLNKYQRMVSTQNIPTQGGFHGTMPGNQPPNAGGGHGGGGGGNTEAEAALNAAWDLYYNVFRRINKQLPTLTNLELQYVSPYLLNARRLELAVPGTYHVDKSAVRIAKFGPTVQVIASKQRPRKITIHGEDGQQYVFLLKGHEDLRQDERAMQLFGLVNALLESDRRTNKHDLSIQRYAVAPLSHNAGVVGWVPNTDTLHTLIRDYRESRKILLNIEHRLMVQMAPDFDALTVMQKLEVFEAALENTAGQDLYRVLWLKSDNSEQWLDRRTTYTRSLAVMSMVGYILGLGDRHPSNLMLDRNTGKILHIDFGDCFEVAMHRDTFPEKIPFRLTRMLVNAMEVSGIEGNYRSTCEHVMGVMRENRDSLLAMLQAFVHDPLISWRLLGATTNSASGGERSPVPVVTGTPPPPSSNAPPQPSHPSTAPKPAAAAAVAPRPVHPVGAAGQPMTGEAAVVATTTTVRTEAAATAGAREVSVISQRRVQLEAQLAQLQEDPGSGEEAARVAHAITVLSEERSDGADEEAQERNPEDTPPAVPPPPGGFAPTRIASGGAPGAAADESASSRPAAIPITSATRHRSHTAGSGGSGQAGSVSDTRFESIQSMAASLRERDPAAASVVANGSVADFKRNGFSVRRFFAGPDEAAEQEALNEKGLAVIRRVQDKLTGRDFVPGMLQGNSSSTWSSSSGGLLNESVGVAEQVDMLIAQATSNERLCQCFIGWCPFW